NAPVPCLDLHGELERRPECVLMRSTARTEEEPVDIRSSDLEFPVRVVHGDVGKLAARLRVCRKCQEQCERDAPIRQRTFFHGRPRSEGCVASDCGPRGEIPAVFTRTRMRGTLLSRRFWR